MNPLRDNEIKTLPQMDFLKKRIYAFLFFLILMVINGCSTAPVLIELPDPKLDKSEYTATPSATAKATATATRTPTLKPTINPLRTIAPTLTPTATVDPFVNLYIESLQSRSYGGGVLEEAGVLYINEYFTRKLIKYRSEGLDLFGFINIPDGEGPFPVIFMFHGFIEPESYRTVGYSARYADALAGAGFIVLHPNLRGYPPSEDGENPLGIGDTVDALNLINLVRQQSGSPGLLEKADSSRIGLWGHSMGGGIVERILVIDPDIDAALLYASIHANEEFNLAHFDKDGRGEEKISASSVTLRKISPFYFFDSIKTPISIHHGSDDNVVPIEWSQFLCSYFVEKEIEVECIDYPGMPHTFRNNGDMLLIENMIQFFSTYLQ